VAGNGPIRGAASFRMEKHPGGQPDGD
jgi:hypothetical protein